MAVLSGNVLEDGKEVIGTAHLGFGATAGIGGVNLAAVHVVGVMPG